jgi:hypothetical protein
MKTFILSIALFLIIPVFTFSQQSDSLIKDPFSITELGDNLKNLVALNSSSNGAFDLSTIDAVHLGQASFRQIVQVTAPYLHASPQARHICHHFLLRFLYPLKNPLERQELLEILCRNFLHDERFNLMNNALFLLSEKDFNDTAKKYVAGLIKDLGTTYYFGSAAQLLSTAQITRSIPALWKIVDTNFKKMQHRDIEVLASLARMNEKKAGILLVAYYNSQFNYFGDLPTKQGDFWRHFLIAKKLAFSLDSSVLNCLINEFRSIDINYAFRDGDTGFYPAQYLGASIVSMIKNYPYEGESYSLKPEQLLAWLATNDVQLKDH